MWRGASASEGVRRWSSHAPVLTHLLACTRAFMAKGRSCKQLGVYPSGRASALHVWWTVYCGVFWVLFVCWVLSCDLGGVVVVVFTLNALSDTNKGRLYCAWGSNFQTSAYPSWKQYLDRVNCQTGACMLTAPVNGKMGDCTSTLPLEATCQPACDSGFAWESDAYCGPLGLTRMTTCARCRAGHYCADGTQAGDEPLCPEGFVCAAGTRDTAARDTHCPAGYSCAAGTSDATQFDHPCDEGFMCESGTTPGERTSTKCPAGWSCGSATTNATKEPCEPRFWCPEGTKLTTRRDNLCLAGYYCPLNTASSHEHPCPAAHYCTPGSDEPTACPAGTYMLSNESMANSSAACRECPKSSYSDQPAHVFDTSSASAPCTPCPTGTQTARRGSSSAAECVRTGESICTLSTLDIANAANSSTGYRGSELELELEVRGAALAAEVSLVPQANRTEVPMIKQAGGFFASPSLRRAGVFALQFSVDGVVCPTNRTITIDCVDGHVQKGDMCVCPDGQTDVNGVCTLVSSVCSQARANFSLVDDRLLGSQAQLVAAITLPGDAPPASVVAVPVESTVTAGAGLRSGWSGTATLPSVGVWSVSLSVGSETCMPEQLNVTCLDGFAFDPTTKTCRCPVGKQNINGVCEKGACDRTAASFSLVNDTELGSTGRLVSSLALPAGATASVAAVPLGSAVTVGSAVVDGDNSTAALPSAGAWEVAVTVSSGSEMCVLPAMQLNVTCLDTFELDPATKTCRCPAGTQKAKNCRTRR